MKLKRIVGVCEDDEKNLLLCGDSASNLLVFPSDGRPLSHYSFDNSVFQTATNELYSVACRQTDNIPVLVLGYNHFKLRYITYAKTKTF